MPGVPSDVAEPSPSVVVGSEVPPVADPLPAFPAFFFEIGSDGEITSIGGSGVASEADTSPAAVGATSCACASGKQTPIMALQSATLTILRITKTPVPNSTERRYILIDIAIVKKISEMGR